MEKFVNSVEKLIYSKINKYKKLIPDLTVEELFNEAVICAIESKEKWGLYNSDICTLSTFVNNNIEQRFKILSSQTLFKVEFDLELVQVSDKNKEEIEALISEHLYTEKIIKEIKDSIPEQKKKKVFQSLIEGDSNKQIAETLNVTRGRVTQITKEILTHLKYKYR